MRPSAVATRDAGLFAVVAAAWGLNYLFVRVGLTLAPPLWLAFLRAGTGALTLLLGLLATGQLRKLDPRGAREAMLIGLPNTAAFFGLWFLAASSIPPGQTAVLVYTFPLWVTLLAGPFLGERPSPGQLVGVVLGFVGVVLVSAPWATGSAALRPVAVVELLAGAVAWAVGTLTFKRRFHGSEVPAANAWQLVGGSLGLLAATLATGPLALPTIGLEAIAIVGWLGILGTAVAYTIWFRLLDRVPAVTLSAYTLLVPVIALAGSAVILGERLSVVQGVGVTAVLLGIYLNATTAQGRAAPAPKTSRPLRVSSVRELSRAPTAAADGTDPAPTPPNQPS